jgi:hypothetical protein
MTEDLFDSPPSGTTDPDKMGNDGAFSVDGKPDRWGRYRLPHPTSGRVIPWTRATTWAKSIADTYKLSQWQQRMAIKGITLRPDLYASTAATPLEDKDTLNKLVESAKEVAGAKTAAGLGSALHSFTEALDRGEDVTPGPWSEDIKAYGASLVEHGLTVLPGMIEGKVVCTRFTVAGTFDRIFRTEKPCPSCGKTVSVGDLKTGADLSYGWNEIAIQLALYAHADAIWDVEEKRYIPMPDVCLCNAIVVHLPVNQHQATLYDVDITQGWRAAELCGLVREWRNTRNLAIPRTVTTLAPTGPVTSSPTWTDRIGLATTPGELSAIWREANAKAEWTDALQTLGMQRLAAIKAEVAGG